MQRAVNWPATTSRRVRSPGRAGARGRRAPCRPSSRGRPGAALPRAGRPGAERADDPRQGFERLAALLVPELGDLCAVWIADGGAPRALAVRHADPRLERVAAELWSATRSRPATRWAGRWPATSRCCASGSIRPLLAELAPDPAQRALLDRAGAALGGARAAALRRRRAWAGGAGDGRRAPRWVRTELGLLGILARRVGVAYEVDRLRAEDRATPAISGSCRRPAGCSPSRSTCRPPSTRSSACRCPSWPTRSRSTSSTPTA